MTSDDLSPTTADGPAGPELDRVRHAFFTARAVQEDPRWAEDALVAMVFSDVRIDVAEEHLVEAATLVQQSQESPEQLYGPAREWVAEQVESLRSSGATASPAVSPFLEPVPSSSESTSLATNSALRPAAMPSTSSTPSRTPNRSGFSNTP